MTHRLRSKTMNVSRRRRWRQVVGAVSIALLGITALRSSIELLIRQAPSHSLDLALFIATLLGLGGTLWWAWSHRRSQTPAALEIAPTDESEPTYRELARRRAPLDPAAIADPRVRPRASSGWLWLSLMTVLACCGLLNSGSSDRRVRWTFLEPTTAHALGFAIPEPNAGGWEVIQDADATGGTALVNHAGSDSAPAAMALAPSISTANLRAKTRCRFGAGQPADGCGIVFRYTSRDSYSVVRLDAGGIVLARVIAGEERITKRVAADVRPGVWYELGLTAEGREIAIRCNGVEKLSAHDEHWREPGGVGLWVPSEGQASFDELAVEPTPSTVDPLSLVILGKQRG